MKNSSFLLRNNGAIVLLSPAVMADVAGPVISFPLYGTVHTMPSARKLADSGRVRGRKINRQFVIKRFFSIRCDFGKWAVEELFFTSSLLAALTSLTQRNAVCSWRELPLIPTVAAICRRQLQGDRVNRAQMAHEALIAI